MRLLNISMLHRLRKASDSLFARECAASLIAQLQFARDAANGDTRRSISEAIACAGTFDFAGTSKLVDNTAQSLISQNKGGHGGLNRLIAGLYFSSAGSQCVAAHATGVRTAMLEPWNICQLVDQCSEDVSAFRSKVSLLPTF